MDLNIAVIESSEKLFNLLNEKLVFWASFSDVNIHTTHFNKVPDILYFMNEHSHADVLIVDLTQYGTSAFNFCKRLRERSFTGQIILTCDNDNFVFCGYDIFAAGYYINPISLRQISHLLNRYLSKPDFLRLSDLKKSKKTKIYFYDIEYLIKNDHYTDMHILSEPSGEIISVRKSLSEIESVLPPSFQRCSRGCIVNVLQVSHISSNMVYLKSGKHLKISSQYVNMIKNKTDFSYFGV